MGLDLYIEKHLVALVTASVILAVLAAGTVLFLLIEIRRIKKPFSDMADLHKEIGTEESLKMLLQGVDENREYIRGHSAQLQSIIERLARCYSGTGIVKFNAFEDIGGMQSYSLCLLTKEKNGIIMTNLVGRNSTRGYALEVKDGTPSRNLSDEEKKALADAVTSIIN